MKILFITITTVFFLMIGCQHKEKTMNSVAAFDYKKWIQENLKSNHVDLISFSQSNDYDEKVVKMKDYNYYKMHNIEKEKKGDTLNISVLSYCPTGCYYGNIEYQKDSLFLIIGSFCEKDSLAIAEDLIYKFNYKLIVKPEFNYQKIKLLYDEKRLMKNSKTNN
jgi:hypothetical protein